MSGRQKIADLKFALKLPAYSCDAYFVPQIRGKTGKQNEETFNRLNNYDEEILYPNVFIISIKIIMKKCHIEAGEKPKLADLLSLLVSKFLPTRFFVTSEA